MSSAVSGEKPRIIISHSVVQNWPAGPIFVANGHVCESAALASVLLSSAAFTGGYSCQILLLCYILTP